MSICLSERCIFGSGFNQMWAMLWGPGWGIHKSSPQSQMSCICPPPSPGNIDRCKISLQLFLLIPRFTCCGTISSLQKNNGKYIYSTCNISSNHFFFFFFTKTCLPTPPSKMFLSSCRDSIMSELKFHFKGIKGIWEFEIQQTKGTSLANKDRLWIIFQRFTLPKERKAIH